MSQDDAPGMGQSRRSRWRKSSYSGTAGNCVEVTQPNPDIRAVRDSKDPDGPVLTCTAQHWSAFTARLRTGKPATYAPQP
jgi:hypothetical protein